MIKYGNSASNKLLFNPTRAAGNDETEFSSFLFLRVAGNLVGLQMRSTVYQLTLLPDVIICIISQTNDVIRELISGSRS